MLVIDPDECIDCTLCEPECPAEAIKSEDDLTDEDEIELGEKMEAYTNLITSQSCLKRTLKEVSLLGIK